MHQDSEDSAKNHKEEEKARKTAGQEDDVSALISGSAEAKKVSQGWNLETPGALDQDQGFALVPEGVTENQGAKEVTHSDIF